QRERESGDLGCVACAQAPTGRREWPRCKAAKAAAPEAYSLYVEGRRGLRQRSRWAVIAARHPLAGFEEAGGALAAPDAHRDDAVARLAPLHLVGDGAHHARAGHAERVPDGDRAAVRVELVHGNAELVAAVDDLRREGLVELPHVDVVHLEPGAL